MEDDSLKNKQAKLLLTGATGFLGQFLVHSLLAEGYGLRALVRNRDAAAARALPASVECAEGDVLDVPALEAALAGCEGVVHAAAMVSFQPQDRPRMKQVNVEGTANLVNLSLEAGIRRFVHISSSAALGRPQPGRVLDERVKWQTSPYNTAYGISKHLAEWEVQRGVAEGLPAVIANPVIILDSGAGSRSSGVLAEQARRGTTWAPPGANGFVSEQDTARAVTCLLASGYETGERFLIVSENRSYQAILELLAEAMGTAAPRRRVPRGLLRLLAPIGGFWNLHTGRRALITPDSYRSIAYDYAYSAARFQQAFSMSFEPMTEVAARIAAAER